MVRKGREGELEKRAPLQIVPCLVLRVFGARRWGVVVLRHQLQNEGAPRDQMETQMTRWAQMLMIAGVLLASATQAKAQGFNPYSGGTVGAKTSKPTTPSDGFSPPRETAAKGAVRSGVIGTDSYRI